ncbi:MAG: PAS domain-containing protein [Treponema sp.]|jgi:two-component system phosphate regulon sensor histidine kinase PhoR|nr:PAS domain-containing protein [Treponema sp.]
MKRKILLFLCVLAGFSIAATAVLIHFVLYWDYSQMMKYDLAAEIEYIRAGIEMSGPAYPESLRRGSRQPGVPPTRVTLIAADGRVLFDTDAGAENMENHLSRREIQDALNTGRGEETRFSETLGKRTYYRALRLSGGEILRMSRTTESVFVSLIRPIMITIIIALIVFAAAAEISSRISGMLVASINRLNLDDPESNVTYEELSPLLIRLKKQNETIAAQLAEQRKKRLEFTAITDNMREGLIILDHDGLILSCNKSARRLLDIHVENLENQNVLVIRRDESFRRLVERAVSGRSAETLLSSGERRLRAIANPVTDGPLVMGAVLVILDVTEKEDREKLRREFSANVSHELKTPLMSISGYAEIMAGGLAKPEDMGRFAQNIYTEAQRLIALIGDILLLSRLDEGEKTFPAERVELLALARRLAERVDGAAAGVSLSVEGQEAAITGMPRILEEMIYNLLDNAVKYNRPGGSVRVSVAKVGGETVLSVSDTGIGIPSAEQERIFERFYRVDKSRGKTAGGTGLGLSIVKHGAALHRARLELQSDGKSGSRFTLRFPAFPGGSSNGIPDGASDRTGAEPRAYNGE